MRVDVFEKSTSNSIAEELEMPCAPQVGSILEFVHTGGMVDRYRVVGVDHAFEVRTVGEAVKEMETTHIAVVCMVESC